MRVAFCHPDLGLGGAERLVIDAALELKAKGNEVQIFTAFHDPKRCFVETIDGTLPPVRVHGNWIPRHIFHKGHALLATLRCLCVAWAICREHHKDQRSRFDAVFADQVSNVLPLFKIFAKGVKLLFYCHFPDLLLAKPGGWMKRLYRWPMNWLEEITTGMADTVLVNSHFTLEVFSMTFPKLHSAGVKPEVLYPATQLVSESDLEDASKCWQTELPTEIVQFLNRPKTATFLSINRFERKKNIELAMHALQKVMMLSTELSPQLIVAGGYDSKVQENKEVYNELQRLTEALNLRDRVCFLRSFTDREKKLLFASVNAAVLYTPSHEHFGIVPLESMASRKPVIACNSGGPRESILDGETGYLVEPTPEAFAFCMEKLMSAGQHSSLGLTARKHVEEHFSRSVFGQKLCDLLAKIVN
eukprot:g912.t1